MRLEKGTLHETLEKGDYYWKAIYVYDGLNESDLISLNDSRDDIIVDIKSWLDRYVDDMESDYVIVFKKRYNGKGEKQDVLKQYEYMYGRLVEIIITETK